LDKIEQRTAKVAVLGQGYVGLVVAMRASEAGFDVVGLEIDATRAASLAAGRSYIEDVTDTELRAALDRGYEPTADPDRLEGFDVAVISVPTPLHEGLPDLSYIEDAGAIAGAHLRNGGLVVLESTSPVGATEQMAGWLADARPDLTFPPSHGQDSDIRIAHCPERVLPGKVMQELISNDRVIGGMTPRCSEMAIRLYRAFVKGECVVTNSRTAELAKLTENSFRDVNIAFANELSMICDELGVNVWELISLANRHPRVNILQPGPGVGGHCIAVDPWFIVAAAPMERPTGLRLAPFWTKPYAVPNP
jgi:UDP-N-acetyl-D-mannosaminuronic acid dehydrogenase